MPFGPDARAEMEAKKTYALAAETECQYEHTRTAHDCLCKCRFTVASRLAWHEKAFRRLWCPLVLLSSIIFAKAFPRQKPMGRSAGRLGEIEVIRAGWSQASGVKQR
jgi:hypothetical protein